MERSAVCVVLLCLVLVAFNRFRVDARTISEDTGIKKEKCIDGTMEYGVGQRWSVLGQCWINTCVGEGLSRAESCGSIELVGDSPCTLTEGGDNKMYPECCPRIVCPP